MKASITSNMYNPVSYTHLAQQYGINMNIDELIIQAEAYAIRKGGRTPRAAKQFIQMLKAKQ